MQRGKSAFEIYVRTGRCVGQRPEPEPIETKFNPWHDPENGRFAFAGQGRHIGTSGKDRFGRSVVGSLSSLRSIPGYPETGVSLWRASSDFVFIAAANHFNNRQGFKPGDPKYIDPQLVKAWAMVESGGSKSSFLSDPLQVNNPGDWANEKTAIAGLSKDQAMTPPASAEAALRWLNHKGHIRNAKGQAGPWLGIKGALERYNGNNRLRPTGVPHKIWYAREVLKLYRESKTK